VRLFETSSRLAMMLLAVSARRLQQTSSVIRIHHHQASTCRHHFHYSGGTWRRVGHPASRSRVKFAKQQSQNSTVGEPSAVNNHLCRRQWMTTNTAVSSPLRLVVWKEISNRPIEFLSIPCVAAFVGISTNWIGVKVCSIVAGLL
jgi:hypothetical protein